MVGRRAGHKLEVGLAGIAKCMLGARHPAAEQPYGFPAAHAQSGRSSGVEHNLAKVGVEGSNPFARSISPGLVFEPSSLCGAAPQAAPRWFEPLRIHILQRPSFGRSNLLAGRARVGGAW